MISGDNISMDGSTDLDVRSPRTQAANIDAGVNADYGLSNSPTDGKRPLEWHFKEGNVSWEL